jgi:uncharacterized protein
MLHLVLKASTACNLNCVYCERWCRGGAGGSMSLEVVQRVLALADDYLAAHPGEAIECLWHGGEPLLLGPAYYHRVWGLQQALGPAVSARIRHGLQTNLTCLNEEFVPILKRLGVAAIGTSFDPEPHVRGGGPDRDSDALSRQFMQALSLVERHGFFWSLTYVVARHSLADPIGVFHFLANLRPTAGLTLNPVLTLDGGHVAPAIAPEEYVRFLGAIFPYWYERRARFPGVEPFAAMVRGIETDMLGPDAMALGVCDTRRNRLAIGPDGSVHPGGWTSGSPERAYGTIHEMGFDDLFAAPGFQEAGRVVRERRAVACGTCRLERACRGTADTPVVPDSWCRARVGFVEEFLEPLTGRRVDHA